MSPLQSQWNVSSSPISCPSTLLVYWPCVALLSYSCFKNSPNFVFLCVVCLFVSLLSFVCFHSSTAYAVIFTIHVASLDFHFCFFCQSCSVVCLYNFAYTSGMVALSVSGWSIWSLLIAVTFLSPRNTVTSGLWFETRSQICLAVR